MNCWVSYGREVTLTAFEMSDRPWELSFLWHKLNEWWDDKNAWWCDDIDAWSWTDSLFMYLQEKTLVALAPQTFHPEDSFDLMD